MPSLEIIYTKDHPAFTGHFPNNPIVPGVMILDAVLNFFSQEHLHEIPSGFNYVKFLRPLVPEKSIFVNFSPASNNKVNFTCSDGNCIYVKGEIKIQRYLAN